MITIKWGQDDKSVLLYEFEGSWSVDDLVEALDAGVEVTRRYEHDMDVIVDLTKTGWPSFFGMDAMKAFSKAMNRGEEHLDGHEKEPGVIVVVSKNGIIRSSLTSMMGMYKQMGERIAVADTLPQAQAIIADTRRRAASAISA